MAGDLKHCRGRRICHVCVVQGNHGGLSAEFEEDLGEVLGGCPHDCAAGIRGAGERDEIDPWVFAQLLADPVLRRGDDVEYAGGMSVSVATSCPRRVAVHGVSGAGLSTTVLPAANAGPAFARLICIGKFHGVMAATTPAGSRWM